MVVSVFLDDPILKEIPQQAVEGQVIYNTDTNVLEYYNGSDWAKISAVLAVLNSVSGNIAAGLATNLSLSGEGFLQSGLVVRFVQSADSIDVSVTVTPSSDTAAAVAVPAAVYNNVTAGRVVTITVTNSMVQLLKELIKLQLLYLQVEVYKLILDIDLIHLHHQELSQQLL